ncbi:MAG: sulfatase [Planctomycetes bacterium]|nr:sulfatase [Planctomycetota bacterium]
MRGPSIARVSLALACMLGFTRCSEPAARPNVVIIALDTLRPDHLGCYGAQRDTSPNLDAWAARSVVFENAQSAAPWTAPSLLSLMTSLYPSVHGVASFPEPGAMNERVTTLAEVLKAQGYATAAFTDGGYAKPQFGLGQGFDIFPLNEGDLASHASNLQHPSRLAPNIDRTLRWIDEFADGPFFLFFHTYEVHGPYAPPEADIRHFRPDYDDAAEHRELERVIVKWLGEREIDAAGLRLVLRHTEHCGAGLGPEKEGLPAKMAELGVTSLEPERMQFWRDLYDAEIRHTDRELARLLERLERPDLRDDTLVVFVSDHGEGFGEHGLSGHGSALHDEALRVLLMVHKRDLGARRVRDVVRSVDVMPTILDVVGVPRGALALQGRSLAPLLAGRALALEPAFSHALSRNGQESRLWSVREGRWRLVWDDQRSSGALYDLESDPLELADRSSDQREIAERMLGLLRAQRDLDALFRERAAGPPQPYRFSAQELAELKHLGYVDGPPALSGDKPLGLARPQLGP